MFLLSAFNGVSEVSIVYMIVAKYGLSFIENTHNLEVVCVFYVV